MRFETRVFGEMALLGALLGLASTGMAQKAAVTVFHPDGPMPSFDVAAIKPADPNEQGTTSTLRDYISEAYGIPLPMVRMQGSDFTPVRVIGGPSWIDKDQYVITTKPPDDLRVAMKTMTRDQLQAQNQMMKQSLLAERFHLKVHIETREMSVLQLVPAKGGLKIKAVDPPPTAPGLESSPVKPMAPTRYSLRVGNGVNILGGRSMTMDEFASAIRGTSPEAAGKPVIDMTGFTGHFDVVNFRFAGLTSAQAGTSGEDIPSLGAELEEMLGLRLVATKAPVEVVVIDSIDRPTEN